MIKIAFMKIFHMHRHGEGRLYCRFLCQMLSLLLNDEDKFVLIGHVISSSLNQSGWKSIDKFLKKLKRVGCNINMPPATAMTSTEDLYMTENININTSCYCSTNKISLFLLIFKVPIQSLQSNYDSIKHN